MGKKGKVLRAGSRHWSLGSEGKRQGLPARVRPGLCTPSLGVEPAACPRDSAVLEVRSTAFATSSSLLTRDAQVSYGWSPGQTRLVLVGRWGGAHQDESVSFHPGSATLPCGQCTVASAWGPWLAFE